MHRCVSCCLVLALALTTVPARAEESAPPATPFVTLARGMALLAVSGLASIGNVGLKRPPLSLVQVVWPTLQPVVSEITHPPTWSVPDGGRKTLFFATLVDLRF